MCGLERPPTHWVMDSAPVARLYKGTTVPRGTSHPRALWAGVKNADEAELRLLASQPLDITVHNVQDFPQLGTLAGLLSRLICQQVQGRSPRGGSGEQAGGDATGSRPRSRPRQALSGHFGQRNRDWLLKELPEAPHAPVPMAPRGSAAPTWGTPVLPEVAAGGAGGLLTPAAWWALGHPPFLPQLSQQLPLPPWTPSPLPPAWS